MIVFKIWGCYWCSLLTSSQKYEVRFFASPFFADMVQWLGYCSLPAMIGVRFPISALVSLVQW